MRVLITGASGFIGRPAVEIAVDRVAEVHAITSSPVQDPVEGVIYHQLDLLADVDELRRRVAAIRPTHLLHLAWYTIPGQYWTSPENARWVDATLALAKVFGEAGGTRFVGAGTCAEYDWNSGVCTEETTPCRPATAYGAAKDTARRMLESWAEGSESSFAWGRLFFLYGPREAEERLVPSVVRALMRGETARVTEGRQARDFLYVRDAAEALVALLLSPVGGTVNIASGSATPVRQLVDRIADELHAADRVHYGALAMRDDDPPMIAADTSRLLREVGWSPRTDLATGVRQTIDWHRKSSTPVLLEHS